jgi:hypothetical protein
VFHSNCRYVCTHGVARATLGALFWGGFAKLGKATIELRDVCLSVCLPVLRIE